MILFNKTLSNTKLNLRIGLKIQVRNYPGEPEKKVSEIVVKELAKKCTGTGCNSTKNSSNTPTANVKNTSTPMAKTTETTNTSNSSSDIKQLSTKDIAKPMTTIIYKNKNSYPSIEEVLNKHNIKESHTLKKQECSKIQEALFFEVLRRLHIVTNNDAIFHGDDMYGKLFVVEGQGFTIKSDVYKLQAQNWQIQQNILLEKSQFNEIFENIYKGNLKVHCFKYGVENLDPNIFKLLESSDEIHMNITTTFTDNSGNKILVSVGQFTSNTDSSTVYITNKQYINKDDKEKNKVQRFRPYTQLVLVPMDKVKEYPEATWYCLQTDLEGTNIQEKIISAIKSNETVIRKNSVRKYVNFTRENLQEIAEDFAQNQKNNLEEHLLKLKNKMKSLFEEKRNEKTNIMENQLKNVESQNKRTHGLKQTSSEYKEMKKDLENKMKYEK